MSNQGDVSHIKVIHVRASNFFGGPEKQIVRHLMLLPGGKIQSLLCSFHEGGKETELVLRARESGIACVSIPCTTAYDLRQIFRLRALFARERPHIICSHDYRSNFLSLMARGGLGIPQIAFWRGTTRENLKVAFYHRMDRWFLKGMDRVVVVSKEQRDFLSSGVVPKERISLVSNAVDVESPGERDDGRENKAETGTEARKEARGTFAEAGAESERERAVLGRFSGKKIIATAGRLSREKGHRYLIEAMPHVLARRNDAVLLIFGEGPMRAELMGLAEKTGCSGSIHFLGFVPDFASLVRGIHLVVLPSLSEGLPNVLLEAMAAARPVVATAVGGVPELIVDGATGLLVSPGNSGEMAGAILQVLSDTELAVRLGQSGQEVVRKTCSFERQCELLMEVYTRVIDGEKMGDHRLERSAGAQ